MIVIEMKMALEMVIRTVIENVLVTLNGDHGAYL